MSGLNSVALKQLILLFLYSKNFMGCLIFLILKIKITFFLTSCIFINKRVKLMLNQSVQIKSLLMFWYLSSWIFLYVSDTLSCSVSGQLWIVRKWSFSHTLMHIVSFSFSYRRMWSLIGSRVATMGRTSTAYLGIFSWPQFPLWDAQLLVIMFPHVPVLPQLRKEVVEFLL